MTGMDLLDFLLLILVESTFDFGMDLTMPVVADWRERELVLVMLAIECRLRLPDEEDWRREEGCCASGLLDSRLDSRRLVLLVEGAESWLCFGPVDDDSR